MPTGKTYQQTPQASVQQTPRADREDTAAQFTPGDPEHVDEGVEFPAACDPARVVACGMNALDAIAEVLGPRPDRRSGDLEADCLAVMAELARHSRQFRVWRKLVLHVLHGMYKTLGGDAWDAVGRRTGYPKATVWAHAHPVLPDES